MNHFLDVNISLFGTTIPIPAISSLPSTNAMTGTGSLSEQSNLCLSQHGYLPTFVLVDYFDMGNVFGSYPFRLPPAHC